MSLKYQEDIDDGKTTYDYDLIVIGGGSGGEQFLASLIFRFGCLKGGCRSRRHRCSI